MAEINKAQLGQRIKSIRLEKGLTLEEFGNLFSTSKSIVSRWENGISSPNPERLKLIAKLGNMSVSQLQYGENGSSLYNKDALKSFISQYIEPDSVDNKALSQTLQILNKAYFLTLGLDDIINIYFYHTNTSYPLKNLEDLQRYFEETATGLESFLDSTVGEARFDLEIQISFLNSYAYKIKKYIDTGTWATNTISDLRENKQNKE